MLDIAWTTSGYQFLCELVDLKGSRKPSAVRLVQSVGRVDNDSESTLMLYWAAFKALRDEDPFLLGGEGMTLVIGKAAVRQARRISARKGE